MTVEDQLAWRRQVDGRKRAFRPGDRVRIDRWAPSEVKGLENGEPSVPIGTEGVVRSVDDAGTVGVYWDNGSNLGACIGDTLTRIACGPTGGEAA